MAADWWDLAGVGEGWLDFVRVGEGLRLMEGLGSAVGWTVRWMLLSGQLVADGHRPDFVELLYSILTICETSWTPVQRCQRCLRSEMMGVG